jgi:hypothetical protein
MKTSGEQVVKVAFRDGTLKFFQKCVEDINRLQMMIRGAIEVKREELGLEGLWTLDETATGMSLVTAEKGGNRNVEKH